MIFHQTILFTLALIIGTKGLPINNSHEKYNIDVSMIMNMLNHNNLRIQKLENQWSSVTNELRKLGEIMSEGMKNINGRLSVIENFVASVEIYIESQSATDPGRDGLLGIGKIFVNGVDRSLHRRGHNIVVIDKITGQFESAAAFDTYGGGSQASSDLKHFIDNIQDNKIVAVSVQDEGRKNLFGDAIAALESLGAVNPGDMGLWGSFAFVGYKGPAGKRLTWQVSNKTGKGPSKLKATVILSRK